MAYQNPLMPQLPGGVPGGNMMPPPGMARPLTMQPMPMQGGPQGGPMQPPMQPGMMHTMDQPNMQFPLNPQPMPPVSAPPMMPPNQGPGGNPGFGGHGPGFHDMIKGDIQNFRNALMDWRGLRPDFTAGGDMSQFRQQMMDWRGQRPTPMDYFGNLLPGSGQVMTPGGGGTGAPLQGPNGQMIVNGGTYPTPSGGAINY
jgi:hypothetical protein